MQGDELSVSLFLWGTTFAFGLAAVTMAGSERKYIIRGLWTISGLFLIASVAWPFVAEKWPALKSAAESVTGNKLTLNLLGLIIFCLLVLDFGLRSRWFVKVGRVPDTDVGTKSYDKSEIEALNNAMQGLFERVGKIELLPSAAAARPNPQAERDLLILINYALYQSSLLMLTDLLDSAPEGIQPGPLQLGGDFALKNDLSKSFIDNVRRKLEPGSYRRMDFENVMRNAEVNAEMQVEHTPMDQRPSGIDPLQIRRWAINHLQCLSAINFLEKQKREVLDNLLNQRAQLLEQYRLRNPS